MGTIQGCVGIFSGSRDGFFSGAPFPPIFITKASYTPPKTATTIHHTAILFSICYISYLSASATAFEALTQQQQAVQHVIMEITKIQNFVKHF